MQAKSKNENENEMAIREKNYIPNERCKESKEID